MQFFGTDVIRYAVVDTDAGYFRVHCTGIVECWSDITNDYQSVSTTETDDIAKIKQRGLSALGATF